MNNTVEPRELFANRTALINGITLIALGVSLFVLDSWGNLFVSGVVGLFWISFLMFVNGPGLLRAMRNIKRFDARQRRINHSFAAYERRPTSY
jgi:hypothetical protein